MNRRIVLLLAAATLVAPPLALAQQSTRRFRVAVLHSAPLEDNPYHAALKKRLAEHGFVEGKNLTIDAPPADPYFDRVRPAAASLIKRKPDAIVAFTSRVTEAVLAETSSVPVVFAWVPDSVAALGNATSAAAIMHATGDAQDRNHIRSRLAPTTIGRRVAGAWCWSHSESHRTAHGR